MSDIMVPVRKPVDGQLLSTTGRARSPSRRNRAGRPTAAELERRKLKIMSVATEMFLTHGFAATTLLDIAKQAGVATRTLYQHFGDKEAIFRDVISASDTVVVAPPVLKDDDDVASALTKMANYSYAIALRPRTIERMRLMIAESTRFPELMGEVATAIFTNFTSTLARLFQEMADKGMIPAGDHRETARLFSDLLLGNRAVMMYFGWVSGPPSDAAIGVRIDLFINGRFGSGEMRKNDKVAS